MNVASFAGYIGRDAKLEKTAGGKAVASFSVAIDNGKDADGKKRDPLWIKCVLWEKKAESLAEHIVKGKMVAVSGPVHVEAWMDHHNQAAAAVVCTVHTLTFGGGPGEHAGDAKAAA